MVVGNMGKRERGRDAYRFLLALSVLVSAAIARSLLRSCRLMNETKMVSPIFNSNGVLSKATKLRYQLIKTNERTLSEPQPHKDLDIAITTVKC